ncbi:exclusion protein FxsA [Tabrizicola sp. TH137]|uniref:FxsA family protein n=1 Tax=Tabrizicola sp. TH137 TaxID=2067452 RepID=UPI000C7AF116|nr:FxsA family protein [Tabrizicola sp. TH137]PLL14696.1 exclusion protein FxsA [Tabrizicola sp. TH137]
MPAFALLLLWPLIEIALFVVIGGWIGLWLTLLIVIGTGVAGVMLLQRMGLRNAERLRNEMGRMRDPLGAAGEGVLKALAALLLILPGFLTDLLGVLLLVPPFRAALVAALAKRMGVVSMRSDQPARRSDGIVIDGEFVELDEQKSAGPTPRTGPPSGWTRH